MADQAPAEGAPADRRQTPAVTANIENKGYLFMVTRQVAFDGYHRHMRKDPGKRETPPTGGGRERFDLTGGDLCLDFVNTVTKRPTDNSEELLGSYEDLLAWALEAGAVPARKVAELRRQSRQDPAAASAALDRARALREAMFAVFSAASAGRPAEDGALDHLNTWLRVSSARLCLASRGRGYGWDWEADHQSFDQVLWLVVRSAGELLTSERLGRLKECAAERCAWMFLDHSKNGSRRWCDMAICGNRAKAKRHRAAAQA
jgi:predicted RNA-binding Zn ribbon-like protein